MVLVSRTNAALGVSDKVMVLCGSALSDAVNQFKYVPFFLPVAILLLFKQNTASLIECSYIHPLDPKKWI